MYFNELPKQVRALVKRVARHTMDSLSIAPTVNFYKTEVKLALKILRKELTAKRTRD